MALHELSRLLAQKPYRLVLTSHWNPDGDAIGSTLGLAHYLRGIGHNVHVIFPNAPSAPVAKAPGYTAPFVHLYDQDPAGCSDLFSQAEGLFSLDYNTSSRVGDAMQRELLQFDGFKVLIDHHQEPDGGYDHVYSQTTKSSTAEMVYDFIASDGGALDMAAADCLLMGLITDTGSFRFPSVSAATLHAASALVEAGAEPHVIHERLFESNPPSRLKLWGRGLNSLEILADGRATLVYLTSQDITECGYEAGDTEGLVNQGLGITGVELSAFAREDASGKVKLSFRSKGAVDVNAFSRAHWNGGGHTHAAGGSAEGNLAEILPMLRRTITDYLHA
ncbi:MAG: hypothetical protein RL168_890 [Bacteroidota bacterium]